MADYVVSTWDEFLQYNSSGNNIKFANPHEVNGEIVLSGTGTQADPYIVSTSEEMLFATNATYLWQVKLIDREQKIYRYEDVYCRYDDSLSTIDFNQIQPEGYNENLEITVNVNGNGWTWKNIVLNNVSLWFSGTTEALTNLKITNLFASSNNTTYGIIQTTSIDIVDSIFDIRMDSLSDNASVPVFKTAKNAGVTGKNLAIHLAVRGGYASLSSTGASNEFNFENSALELDIDSSGFYIGQYASSQGGSSLTNVLVTGNIKTTSDVRIGRYITNCIYDVSCLGEGRLVAPSNTVKAASFYNSDKVEDETGLAVTNMIGATTNELKYAQYLYDHGLPIGVGDE